MNSAACLSLLLSGIFGSVILPDAARAQEVGEFEELHELEVTATFHPEDDDRLAGLSRHSVLRVDEETLRRNAQGTLGDTLGWEPGISSNSFTPGASRPVIRGLEGYRVRMLRDQLDAFDLSDMSPDHGVALEPFLLETVEIHRGPASLLYGSSAIGGAVNTRSRVIARELPERWMSGAVENRYESISEGLSTAGWLSLRADEWVFRFTGSWREAGDIRIPGKAWSEEYEELENPSIFDPTAGGGAGALIPLENPEGKLPNSFHDGSTWSAGVSWLPSHLPLTLGLSYSRFDSLYGVPYIFPGDATDLYGDYQLDLAQDRFDFEGALDFDDSFVSRIETRLGYGAYRHTEFFTGKGKDEGRDFADTSFEKDAIEGRVDVHHRAFDETLTGVIGFSARHEDFTSIRTVVPPPGAVRAMALLRSDQYGLYALENVRMGEWTARLGQRVDYVDVLDHSLEAYGFNQGESGWSSATSGSLTWEREGVWELDRLSVSGTASRVERQPTAIERYAFWNNAGIGRFLIGGDLDGTPLDNEKSLGFELAAEAVRGPLTGRLNLYHYDFESFIFLQEDPAATGGFGRAVNYIGRDATFTGFETELDWKLYDADPRALTLTFMSDYVRGQNETDDEPLPRMPPWRAGLRLEWKDGPRVAGIEVRHAAAQDRVKPEPRRELETDAYTMVNADFSWAFPMGNEEFTVFLRAINLLNDEARLSTSFRKDVAPLPGRGLMIGVRAEF